MARQKNVERKHFVQEYTPGENQPGDEWLELAHLISNIAAENNEETETEAFYDGDGTPEETVTSIARAYAPEGYFDPEDPAQELIESLQYETGDGRKIWHKVVRSDGKKQWVGRATVTNIIAGSGEASAYEAFSCNIRFDRKPEETEPNGEGGGDDEGNGTEGASAETDEGYAEID